MRDFIHVNLLPIEYRVVKRDYSWLLDWRIVVPTLVLIGAGIGYMMGVQILENNLSTSRAALTQIETEIQENGYIKEKIQELERVRDEKSAKNTSLKSISVSKRKWVRILEGANQAMPLNTWLESIKQNESDETGLELKGRTYVFPEVAQYMVELQRNEYFQKVALTTIEFQKEGERSSFQFVLRITLNPNAGIDNFVFEDGKEKVL